MKISKILNKTILALKGSSVSLFASIIKINLKTNNERLFILEVITLY